MLLSECDAPTRELVIAALDDAWLVIGDAPNWSLKQRVEATAQLMRQFLIAVEAGQRNRWQMVRAAISTIELP